MKRGERVRGNFPRCAAVLLLMLLTAGTGGCVRVATQDVPPGGTDDVRAYRARNLKIDDGHMTRDQLVQLLGPPDYVQPDVRRAAYRWQTVRFEKEYPDYLNTDPPIGTPAGMVYNSLLLEFDDAGVVRAHRKFSRKYEYGGPPSLRDMLTSWEASQTTRQ
jgi:hypothetical protein